jgi:hypothetical protein
MTPERREKLTRVLAERSRAVELSRIPPGVVAHYQDVGSVLSVAYADAKAIAQYQVSGRVPVFRDELPEDCHKSLLHSGWREEKTDGTYRIGDCLLYVQPEEQRDMNRLEHELDWLRLDDEDTYRAQLEEVQGQVSSALGGNVRLEYTHLAPASAHVRRGLAVDQKV